MNANTIDRKVTETTKIACLSRGVRAPADVLHYLSAGGSQPLSLHEYPTTGGLTMVLPEDVYVNAPFDEWFCADASVSVELCESNLVLRASTGVVPVERVLPLPGYLETRDEKDRPVVDVAMSHADRLRLSPFYGCAYDCHFCDLATPPYECRPIDQLIAALRIAAEDTVLAVRHVLISGGSPRKLHYDLFTRTCEEVIWNSPFPVDVMFSPMDSDGQVVDRLVDAGVHALSINLEVFDDAAAERRLPRKYRVTRRHFEPTVERAVELLGRGGRVRSLIIPGLEDLSSTIAGVEYLASLGCDPVLSPFRPASDVELKSHPPPSEDDLTTLLAESRQIVSKYGVSLGPSCVPCQHNTLTFPWDVRCAA